MDCHHLQGERRPWKSFELSLLINSLVVTSTVVDPRPTLPADPSGWKSPTIPSRSAEEDAGCAIRRVVHPQQAGGAMSASSGFVTQVTHPSWSTTCQEACVTSNSSNFYHYQRIHASSFMVLHPLSCSLKHMYVSHSSLFISFSMLMFIHARSYSNKCPPNLRVFGRL